jgi:hypothetical protein
MLLGMAGFGLDVGHGGGWSGVFLGVWCCCGFVVLWVGGCMREQRAADNRCCCECECV